MNTTRTTIAISPRGVARRLRGLAASGHPDVDVARWIGVVEARVRQMQAHGSDSVDIVADVARVYARESGQTGRSMATRMRAKNAGWRLPEAWQDIDLDQRPGTPVRRRVTIGSVRVQQLAEASNTDLDERGRDFLMLMARQGVEPAEIARQLQLSVRMVVRELQLLNRPA